jgi:GTPase
MLRVVIVGRPNVGKSALLNRLAKRTVSIVHDQPGVTRDRITAVVQHQGKSFEFIDTGGIGLFESETTPKIIAEAVQMQVDIAIESADLILAIVDGLHGVTPLDYEIITKLRKSGKKIWLIINKLDLPKHENNVAEFYQIGVNPCFLVSAAHGRGIDELWQQLEREEQAKAVPNAEPDSQQPDAPRITVVGRPNVGKSSLVNRLLGAERVIVSEVPGTTRDSVDLPVQFNKRPFTLIDTAGLRQKAKINTNVEMYSRHWTEKSIARADIVLLMLSAPEGATRQDREIAGLILEHEKPCIILVNKWDLNETLDVRKVEKKGEIRTVRKKRRTTSRSEYEASLRYYLSFMDYAPLLFVSALEGYHALGIWKEIDRVAEAKKTTFTTGVLNRIFAKAQKAVQPPIQSGKRLKIYYVSQKSDAPIPTFILFVNQKRLWIESYGRYLKNQLREEEPMRGCPISFILRERATAGKDRELAIPNPSLFEG